MAENSVAAAKTEPLEINGVPLYTRTGKIRERFGENDRLRILGGFGAELKTFVRLFAPRRSPYIYRRKGGNWCTVHHVLQRDEVVKHLLVDRIPGVAPVWVGTRAWKKTLHAAIDVDFRGDIRDFEQRCSQAEKVLLRLGIPRQRMLVCPTPSGGRHYRIFFRRPVFTDQLPLLFEMAGLPLAPGQFEVFPSEAKGIRLPFGHIPGQSHDPTAWVDFIRAYDRKEFPRVNWDAMVKRSNSIQQKCMEPLPRPASTAAPRATTELHSRPVVLGIPKYRQKPYGRHRLQAAPARSKAHSSSILKSPVSKKEFENVWKQGITKPGTRVSLTKALAWHLIFVEHLPSRTVSEMLVEWVYRTGKTTSKDVQADVISGSRKVEQQTHEIVDWYETRRNETTFRSRRIFAKQELDVIIALVKILPEALQTIRARFILDFLNFAKKMGMKSEKGYECKPSVDGVIKKWENCGSASHYRRHLDWALEVGLIVLVKEKSQWAHRPRTYAVVVPSANYENWSLAFQAGLDYIHKALAEGPVSQDTEPCHSFDDGYRRIASLEPRERSFRTSAFYYLRISWRAEG